MKADVDFVFPEQRKVLARGSFAKSISIEKIVDGVVSGWTICDTSTVFLHDFFCFFALQETNNWTISSMHVLGHIVYGRDLGKTATLCPRQVKHFRRSWVSHDRVTAILAGSAMIMSVYMPHRGYDEEEYSATLDAVRNTLMECKTLGAEHFFIGGYINIALKFDDGHEDSIDWYAIYGSESHGRDGDIITYEKKLRWLQLFREFRCAVTSTWVEGKSYDECFTWRAWSSRARKKQIDYTMELRDKIASTC